MVSLKTLVINFNYLLNLHSGEQSVFKPISKMNTLEKLVISIKSENVDS